MELTSDALILKQRINKLKRKIQDADRRLNLAKVAVGKGEIAIAQEHIERVESDYKYL